MTAKHTPGPWINDGSGNITHQDEQPIAFVNWTAYDAGQANSRLIAAAPDLLDALKTIVEVIGNTEYGEIDRKLAVKDARAAIAKALGETK